MSNAAPYIDTWIELAMSRNVKNLSLIFNCFGYRKYSFPDVLYINSSVKQLSVELNSYDMVFPSRSSVSWTSLKKLSLRYCKLSYQCIANILSGCPVLESLTLYSCGFNEPRVLDLSKSLSLRTLEIDRSYWFPGPTQIVAPHIHCLRLRNSLFPCNLADVASLTEASLDIYFHSLEELQCDFDNLQVMVLINLLEKLRNVKKLTFGEEFLQILSLVELRRVPFPSFKVKVLTLETVVSKYVIPGLVRVLQSSPELKKLTLHIMVSYTIPENYLDNYLNSHGLNLDQCWSSEAMVFEKFSCRNLEPKHMGSFMELMLKNTKTLEKMVVRLKNYLKDRDVQELREMVPMLSHNNNNVSIALNSTKPNQRV